MVANGLFHKFNVTDMQDNPITDFFVLRPTSDLHARIALAAYKAAVQQDGAGINLYSLKQFRVTRTDQSPVYGCSVLQPHTDIYARIAMLTYAASVERDNADLAEDLRHWIGNLLPLR